MRRRGRDADVGRARCPDVDGRLDDAAVRAQPDLVRSGDCTEAESGQGRRRGSASGVHVLYGREAERAVAQGTTGFVGV